MESSKQSVSTFLKPDFCHVQKPTMQVEVEQLGQILSRAAGVTRIGESSIGVPKFIEERVNHGVDSRETLSRSILEELGNKINRVRVSLTEHLRIKLVPVLSCSNRVNTTHLVEWVWLDLWEFVLHVVGVHGTDLIPSRSTKHLDNLDQLVNTRFSGEQGLTEHELGHDATS